MTKVVFDQPPVFFRAPARHTITADVSTYIIPDRTTEQGIDILLNNITIEFTPSTATDAVSYRLYYVEDGNRLDFDSPYIEITDLTTNANGRIEVVLTSVPAFAGLDGTYDFGVSAIDDAGNESSTLTVLENVPVDFLLPPSPGYIGIKE